MASITRKTSLALTRYLVRLILLILLLGTVAVILLVYELWHKMISEPTYSLLLTLRLSRGAIRLHLPSHQILSWRISLRAVWLHRIYYLL